MLSRAAGRVLEHCFNADIVNIERPYCVRVRD